ncbi:hypothetical protein KAU15_07585 [candidate division WOR-3 bacterium]|nr:hypothetical protein [candidate division WOR-3 bacterium]
MKKKISIIILIVIMLFISINILGSNVTVEEFKNKLSTMKRNKIETMECNIEIELEGNIIGNTKMYMKENKMRMEIKGNVEAGIGDIIIIQDSTGSYTKINNEWKKGGEENNIMDQMKMFDHDKMINEIVSKQDFKIESMKNNKATISYKEVMGLMGVSNIRMGLDLENGNILFQEQTFNTGKALIEFKYDKGKNIPIEVIVKNFSSDGNNEMRIRMKNMRINHKMSDKIFEYENK